MKKEACFKALGGGRPSRPFQSLPQGRAGKKRAALFAVGGIWLWPAAPLLVAPLFVSLPAQAAGSRQAACKISFEPVARLGLSARVENILRENGIETAGDLALRRPEELLKLHRLGPAALRQIQEALEKKGLELEGGRGGPEAPQERKAASVQERQNPDGGQEAALREGIPPAGAEGAAAAWEKQKILDQPISRLSLSKKAANALRAAGVLTVGGLAKMTEPALEASLLTKGTLFTRKSRRARREAIQNIKSALLKRGLSLQTAD